MDRTIVEQEKDELFAQAVRDDRDSLDDPALEKTTQVYRCRNLSCQHETTDPHCTYNELRRRHEIRCPECLGHIQDGKPAGFVDIAGLMTRNDANPQVHFEPKEELTESDYNAIMSED